MLIVVFAILLVWLSAAVSIHEQKNAKKKMRQRERMKRHRKVIDAIDRMLSNPAQLQLSHFTYSRMHKRMILELGDMLPLANEMRIPTVTQRQMLMKRLQHEASFSQHSEKSVDRHLEPLSIDNNGISSELKALELHRISRLLSKGSLADLTEHDALRFEINTLEASATFFKLLQSKALADSMFMKDMLVDAQLLYIKILQSIEKEIPDSQQVLAKNLIEFCKKRLDTISIFEAKQDSNKGVVREQQTDGLENYFVTKKKFIPVHVNTLSISGR